MQRYNKFNIVLTKNYFYINNIDWRPLAVSYRPLFRLLPYVAEQSSQTGVTVQGRWGVKQKSLLPKPESADPRPTGYRERRE